MRLTGIATVAVLLASATAAADHGGDRDCSDFRTRAEAQAHFNAHPGDPDRLDADNDGLACESLPGGVGVGGTAPVGGVDAGAGGSAAEGIGGALIVSGLMLVAGGGVMIRKARRT